MSHWRSYSITSGDRILVSVDGMWFPFTVTRIIDALSFEAMLPVSGLLVKLYYIDERRLWI